MHDVGLDGADKADADDDDEHSDAFISAESAKSLADALEAVPASLELRHASFEEAIAARSRTTAATCTLNLDWDSVSTEDLMDAFGHQKEILEKIIVVARGGEVSVW